MTSPLRSLLWSGLDTLGMLLVGIVSVLGIARLIGDAAFGLGAIGLGLVFMVAVAVSSLVHDAIVRHPELVQEDVDVAFTASLLAAVMAMALMAGLAVPFGRLFDEPQLASVLLALLPIILFNAGAAPVIAERRRALDFPLVGRQQIIARFLGLAVGLGAALAGAGVWSLVLQQVTLSGYTALAMMVLIPRRPRLRMSWPRLAPMLGFCKYIVGTQFLIQAGERMFLVAMGYWHGISSAGHWGVATRLSENITMAAMQAIYHVALAYMARLQDAREQLAAAMLRCQTLLMMAALPLLTALAACAEPLIHLLLGPGWDPVAWLLLGCLLNAFLLIRRLMPLVALNAIGRPDVSTQAMIGENLTAGGALLVAGSISPMAIAAIRGLSPIVAYSRIAHTSRRELGRSRLHELFGTLRDLACGVGAFLLGRWLAFELSDLLLVQILVAGGAGFSLALMFEAVCQPRTTRELVRDGMALARARQARKSTARHHDGLARPDAVSTNLPS